MLERGCKIHKTTWLYSPHKLGAKTNWTRRICSNFQVWCCWHAWKQPRQELMPPPKIQLINSELTQIGWSHCENSMEVQSCRAERYDPVKPPLAAWCRRPISDFSWCLEHQRWPLQAWISSCMAWNLSAGRQATWATESSSIPKTTFEARGWTYRLVGVKGHQ